MRSSKNGSIFIKGQIFLARFLTFLFFYGAVGRRSSYVQRKVQAAKYGHRKVQENEINNNTKGCRGAPPKNCQQTGRVMLAWPLLCQRSCTEYSYRL